MSTRQALLLASFLAAVAAPAHAQVIRGRVLEPATQSPLPGVVVQLLDSASRTSAQALTNERGEYRLPATPGRWRVRTLRIGFRPAVSEPIAVVAGQDVVAPPLVAGVAISLDTVRVVGRNQCRDIGSAAATFAVWEQARTALTATEITGQDRVIGATLVTFQRRVEPSGRRVLEQFYNLRRGFMTDVWRSLPVDSLRRVGYVQADDRGWLTYYAPDLRVLLADEFVQDHCFRLVPETGSGRIGIAFEPRRNDGDRAGIRGTIWVNRATSELRSIEFRYTNRSDAEERAEAGGEMEFARMRNGAWVISRWNIRMPLLESRQVPVSGISARGTMLETDVTELRVEGGLVALVTQGSDTLWRGRTVTLVGSVADSATGAPVPGTLVSLRGAGRDTVTDELGRFTLKDLIPGEYMVDVRTPRLRALGTLYSQPVFLTDTAQRFSMLVPDAARLARSQCDDRPGGIIAGRVLSSGGKDTRPGATVVAEWQDGAVARWLEVRADGFGNYRVCGAPFAAEITVRAQTDSAASLPARFTLADNAALATTDLRLDQPLPDHATLTGIVLSDVNAAPIMDVEVSIPQLSRVVYSDGNGRFRIAGLAPGTHLVTLRRIGWQPKSLQVALRAGVAGEQRVLLSRVQVMDTVTIAEGTGIRGLDENMKLGIGTFMTRRQIEPHEGRRTGDILRMRGVPLKTSASGSRSWVIGGRSTSLMGPKCYEVEGMTDLDKRQGRNCGCFAHVYIDGMRVFGGGEGEIVPDLNNFPPNTIEAIEYFRGGAQTPMQYTGLNTHCGVIVIHTRRFRTPKKEAEEPQRPDRPPQDRNPAQR